MKNTDDNVVEFEGQDELELTSHPHQMGTDTQLRITKEQSSVFELLRRESRGDLVLAPDFQRTDVWDKSINQNSLSLFLWGFLSLSFICLKMKMV